MIRQNLPIEGVRGSNAAITTVTRRSPKGVHVRTITIDPPVTGSRSLLHRAGGLRAQARHLDPVLAASFRRRACELEFESWLLEIRAGRPDHRIDLGH